MAKETIEGYKLSPQQEHVWLLQQHDRNQPYRVQCVVLIEGNLDPEVLAAALETITGRHQILRTTFRCLPGMAFPVQVIDDNMTPAISFHDVSHLDEPQQEAVTTALYQELVTQAFDFEQGPLLHLSLIRLSPACHKLVISLPTLCIDQAGLGNLVRDIARSYAACLNQTELPSEPIQYIVISEWLNELLVAEEWETGRDYWHQQDTSNYLALHLPLHKRPSVEAVFAHRSHRLVLGHDLMTQIEAIITDYDISIAVFLMACWQALVWKHSKLSDVTIGTACDGRANDDLVELLGLLTRFIPLQIHLEADLPFTALLHHIKSAMREAREWQEFYSWKQVSQIGKSLSEEPFFPLCFEYGEEETSFAAADLRFAIAQQDVCLDRFQLKLSCRRRHDTMLAEFHYNADLFTAEAIACLMDQFQQLILSITKDPEASVSQIQLLTPAQRHQLLVSFNHVPTTVSPTATLPKLLRAQVHRSPDAIAVSCQGHHLSYRELNRQSNLLAHHLRRLGAGPDSLIGILMYRSTEMVVSLLAVLKVGAAYVPLDPGYPAQRLALMVADAGLEVLLTQAKVAGEVTVRAKQMISVDQQWEEISRESEQELEAEPEADQLAYVMYTSGSTGTPKGAMITHRAIANHMLWIQEAFGLTAADRVLQKTPFSFDASVWEFFWPLIVGARLVMARSGGHQDTSYLAQVIAAEQITTLQLVPSMLEVLLEEGGVSRRRSLRRVFCGGEVLSVELQERFYTKLQAPLYNLYGPTEAAIDVCYWPCQHEDWRWRVPIGRPIANTRLYILDQRGEPTPIGVSGELQIGGVGVGRGYWQRAELTAEKFIPDEVSGLAGERLYRTGDLARYLVGGEVEYLGRADEQVKVRGYRIELGEIEAVVRQQASVREAVVVVRGQRGEEGDGGSGSQQLVCYVVWQHEGTGEAGEEESTKQAVGSKPERVPELRQFVRERVPEYMVPAQIVELAEMPLLPNGKLDRQRLQAMAAVQAESSRARYAGPGTAAEAELCRIWEQVLGVERVGIHDNFFQLGGDSILGIQIVARAKQAGLQLSPRQLFQHQTVAELASIAGTTSPVNTEQGVVTGPVPLTPIQLRFFETHPLAPHHYNQSVMLEVPSDLDTSRWRQIVFQLMVQHDGLRLRFHRAESGWRQINARIENEPPFIVVDLSILNNEEQTQAIATLATQSQTSLHLSEGPLLRAVLFSLGCRRQARLLIIAHHLIMDGVSWRILLEDLQRCYEQLSSGERIKLPPKTTSFQQWAQHLNEQAQSVAVRRNLDHWIELLSTPVSRVPVELERGINDVASAETVRVKLSEEETRALLQDVPAAFRTEINDVLLTALAETYTRWSGERGLLVDVEGHGREEVAGLDVTRTVGWFTTYYPIPLQIEESAGELEDLKSVKEQLRNVSRYGMSYTLLYYLCGDKQVSERMRALPQAEIIFNYLGQFDRTLGKKSEFASAREDRGESQGQQEMRTYLFEINAEVAGGQFQLAWSFSANLHCRATIEALAENYLAALRCLIALPRTDVTPGITPSDFPLARLEQRQLDELLRGERGIEDVYPLSPMQQGILFHSLCEPGSGVYFVQQSYNIRGEIEGPVLERAWHQVIDRHPSLRAAFAWHDLAEPLQIVRRYVRTPWVQHDWRMLTPVEQQERLEAFLRTDRARGFDLTQPPLMRHVLIRLSEDTYQFIWSNHQILLDGWSVILVLKEVTALYNALRQGLNLHLEERKPYRYYIEWLQKRNLFDAERFWRKALKGFMAPTTLGFDRECEIVSEREDKYRRHLFQWSLDQTAALQSMIRDHQLTLNTLLQGAWALLLHSYSGEDEVVFGATSSGRPAELAGVEFIVGLFINTLPVRVEIADRMTLLDWLKKLQEEQSEVRQYEFSPLTQVQGWSGVPRGLPLFESLLVFENYPEDKSLREPATGLKLSGMNIIEQTNYPLTLVASPGDQLSLSVIYDRCRFEAAAINRIMGQIEILLNTIAAQPKSRLCDLLPLLQEQEMSADVPAIHQHAYQDDRFSF